MNSSNEIKGSPGEIPKRNFTGGLFYILRKLLGIGRVTTLPDIKQGFGSLSMNTRNGPWRVPLLLKSINRASR